MPLRKDITGIILAGGKSSRMGTDKALMQFQGEKLIERTMRTFRSVFPQIMIITNTPLDYLDQDAGIATDIFPGKGPLGGIYTGLFYSPTEYAFVAACDQPFFNPEFICHMIDRIGPYDIVVPQTERGPEPLHAIYSRKCVGRIHALLGENRLKITGFYKSFRTLYIPSAEYSKFEPGEKMFYNMNTLSDLEKIS